MRALALKKNEYLFLEILFIFFIYFDTCRINNVLTKFDVFDALSKICKKMWNTSENVFFFSNCKC